MSLMKRLGGRLPDFEEVVRRFPVTVVIMAAFTVWIIADNHFGITSYRKDQYIYSGFILAGYVSVIVKLIIEARNGSFALGVIVGIALAVLAFLFSYFSKILDFTAVMAVAAAVIFLGNAAAWRGGRQDRNVWNFTQKLWTGALFAVVGSVIFLLGMLAISEAIKALFGVNFDDLTMETILPVGLAFLAPVYWLGTLPRYGEAEDVTELSFEARALSFLGTWMLAPLVIIYALIVLAYGAKILIQWDLPKGEIAQLVSPFIGVGMLVWLMLEPKVLKESGFVRFYRAAWHWIMLPAAVLLGVAVFVRIAEYDYTPIRFFLALVVTWAVVQSLWFIFMPKARRDIRVPTALAAMLLAFGAFAAEPISTMSQFQRAIQAKQSVPDFNAEAMQDNPEQAKRLLSGLEYFVSTQNESRFKRLLPDYEMPVNTYGADYASLVVDLGLDKIAIDTYNLRSYYTVSSDSPISLETNSAIYVGPVLNLYESSRVSNPIGILKTQTGRTAVLLVRGETFRVNFEDVFSNLNLERVDNSQTPAGVTIPMVPIKSNNEVSATLVVLSGNFNYLENTLEGGNITFAVIVPN